MRTDSDIKRDVEEELKYDADINFYRYWRIGQGRRRIPHGVRRRLQTKTEGRNRREAHRRRHGCGK
jgi:hypothetical protein